MNAGRLAQATSFGCTIADLTTGDTLAGTFGEREVDAASDAVGSEAHGHGVAPAPVLTDIMDIARAGASLDTPGLSAAGDLGALNEVGKVGQIGGRPRLDWAQSDTLATGRCPVKRYNRQLMNLILADKAQVAKAVNATTITLDEAAQGHAAFDKGAAHKFVIDPHGMVRGWPTETQAS